MRITAHQLRQVIREELMLITEGANLGIYQKPEAVKNGTQIQISLQPPPQPPGSTAPPPAAKKYTSKTLGVKVVIPDVPFVGKVVKILAISNLRIETWNPAVPDGQPFMTAVFSVAAKSDVKASLKNKDALDRIAKAIINGVAAEGEMMSIDPADPNGTKAALIVNY